MPKNQPNFGKSLAIHALSMFYQYDVEEIKTEIKNMQLQYSCEPNIIKKLYLKVQKTEINNIMIRSILFCLPQLKQRFIEEKYKKGKTWVALSMQLYTSKPQLIVWHNEILHDIANMMLYQILPDNIFSKEKVLNIIHILDQQIEILENKYKETVDEDILHMLKQKKSRFTALYKDMTVQVHNAQGVQNKILLKKMECNNATSHQIACFCKVSESSVSYCLGNYRKKLIEEKDYNDLLA
ncbi:MAG: hypothetical protein ABFD79_18285 [Phycisphaerales bacterium]